MKIIYYITGILFLACSALMAQGQEMKEKVYKASVDLGSAFENAGYEVTLSNPKLLFEFDDSGNIKNVRISFSQIECNTIAGEFVFKGKKVTFPFGENYEFKDGKISGQYLSGAVDEAILKGVVDLKFWHLNQQIDFGSTTWQVKI